MFGKAHEMKESVLYPIHEQICAVKSLEDAQAIILKHLEAQERVRGKAASDLQGMYRKVRSFTSLKALHFWFYNNILAYNHCKVVKTNPDEQIHN